MTSAGGWSGGRGADRSVLIMIAVFSALRVAEALAMGLGTDESYTLAVTRVFELSYFDHPPLHYWIVRTLAPLLGYGRFARLPFIALMAASTWLTFRLSSRLFSETAGVWAALTLNLTAFFGVAAGDWVLPDGPLVAALLVAALALVEGGLADADETPVKLSSWLWAGVWIGLAALSKYQSVLFCVGLGLFLMSDRRRRAELTRPGPYLAAAITLAFLTPVLIWNAQHHFASFAFQGGRGAPHGVHIDGPFTALAGQLALLLPWTAVPIVCAGIGAIRGRADPKLRFCLLLAAPAILLFTLSPLIGPRTLPHWSMPGWLFLIPPAGALLAEKAASGRAWPRRWAIGSTVVLVVIGALAAQEAATGWLGGAFPKQFKKGDPTAEAIEWTGIKGALAQRDLPGGRLGPGGFVVALKWNEAGKIGEALDGSAPLAVFSSDPREFAYQEPTTALVGHDAVILARPSTLVSRMDELKTYFASVTPAPPIFVGRQGRPEIEVDVAVGHQLLKPYPLPGK